MACKCGGTCSGCDPRQALRTQADWLLRQSPYQAGGFRITRGEVTALAQKQRAPYVYRDSLGNGGATAFRFAQTEGDQGWSRQLGQIVPDDLVLPTCVDATGEHPGQCFNFSTFSCGPCDPSAPLPGELPLPDPGGSSPIPGVPWPPGGAVPPLPGDLPAGGPVLTEEQCRVREARARDDARANVVMIAIVSGAVSAAAGVLVSRLLRR